MRVPAPAEAQSVVLRPGTRSVAMQVPFVRRGGSSLLSCWQRHQKAPSHDAQWFVCRTGIAMLVWPRLLLGLAAGGSRRRRAELFHDEAQRRRHLDSSRRPHTRISAGVGANGPRPQDRTLEQPRRSAACSGVRWRREPRLLRRLERSLRRGAHHGDREV